MSNANDSFFELQTAVAGRYSLVRELGRGGMGIVYLARDVALDRPVAIKMLPPSLAENAELRGRFLREARTVAQLSHPNIVPIHAVEEHDGLVFFVMSYVDGETLGDRVRRAGPLAPADAIRVMREVAWALGHAHARGIIHRDVKPDNVLLDADSGRAVVTDFGIAASRMTTTGENVLGTPQYLSPEQARGEPVEPRSDLYSLGATAWFALTGSPPFAGTMPQLLHRHATDAAPPLASVRAGVPASLARAIDRCLAKNVAERPASADALAVELGQSAALAPVIPEPVRQYLRAVSGTEVQRYVIASLLTAATALVLNNLPVRPGSLVDVNSIIATISGFASAASFVVSGALMALRAKHVRELTRAGFDYRAVRRAVEQERTRLAAETAPPSPVRAVQIGVGGAIATIGSAMLAIAAQSYGPGFFWATTGMVSGLLTVRAVVDAGVAPAPGVRGRLLQAIERWMFRELAVKNVPRAVTDGEATVVALGGAIQNLWQQLPDGARSALAEVPRIAAQLEDEAVRLRASADPLAAERLQTVVAAMESLRLDLLRVQSGTVEPSALTVQIEAARRVGEHVSALLESKAEVESLLRPEITPV